MREYAPPHTSQPSASSHDLKGSLPACARMEAVRELLLGEPFEKLCAKIAEHCPELSPPLSATILLFGFSRQGKLFCRDISRSKEEITSAIDGWGLETGEIASVMRAELKDMTRLGLLSATEGRYRLPSLSKNLAILLDTIEKLTTTLLPDSPSEGSLASERQPTALPPSKQEKQRKKFERDIASACEKIEKEAADLDLSAHSHLFELTILTAAVKTAAATAENCFVVPDEISSHPRYAEVRQEIESLVRLEYRAVEEELEEKKRKSAIKKVHRYESCPTSSLPSGYYYPPSHEEIKLEVTNNLTDKVIYPRLRTLVAPFERISNGIKQFQQALSAGTARNVVTPEEETLLQEILAKLISLDTFEKTIRNEEHCSIQATVTCLDCCKAIISDYQPGEILGALKRLSHLSILQK